MTIENLSHPQWVAGQLQNILLISDIKLIKDVIQQVIYLMWDAAGLPWPAVHPAWATLMHKIEEGGLQWAYSTPWLINRKKNISDGHFKYQCFSTVSTAMAPTMQILQ